MLAVIKTGGKQYKVKLKDKIKIEKLNVPEGKEILFDQVLMVGDDKSVKLGNPLVVGAKVKAKVLKQGRKAKVTGVKFKNKIRYRKYFGHRQHFTQVEITSV